MKIKLFSLDFSDCHKTDAQIKTKGFLNKLPSITESIHCRHWLYESHVSSLRNLSLIMETNQKFQTFLELSDCRDSGRSITNNRFSTEYSTTNIKLSIGNLTEQTEPIVLGD